MTRIKPEQLPPAGRTLFEDFSRDGRRTAVNHWPAACRAVGSRDTRSGWTLQTLALAAMCVAPGHAVALYARGGGWAPASCGSTSTAYEVIALISSPLNS